MAYAMGIDSTGNVSIWVLVPLLSIGLFTCCMVCHGELVRLKPDARYLTHFYLMISAGGAAGGLLVGLIAPHFFNSFYEMPIGLALCGVATLIALRATPDWTWPERAQVADSPAVGRGGTAVLGFYWQSIWSAFVRGWSPGGQRPHQHHDGFVPDRRGSWCRRCCAAASAGCAASGRR